MIARYFIVGIVLCVLPPAMFAQSVSQIQKLTVQQAQELALKNNPAINVARLTALASQQTTREARSAYYPSSSINLTGVDSLSNSRVTAGGLNNPIIYPRVAEGIIVSQLVTDFGRTPNLVASAKLQALADDQNAQATVAQIKLAVNQAFYSVLQSRAILTVAQQTVSSRQILSEQVGALTRSKLKSDLDLSFANVNLAQAQLLLLDAQNQEKAALAAFSEVLGSGTRQELDVIDDSEPVMAPTSDLDSLLTQAIGRRPELASLQFEWQAAQKFRDAEHDLTRPNVRAVGTVGETPIRADQLSSRFGAVGFNIEIPIFNGFLFNARKQAADYKAQAANQRLLDLGNRIARDVHIAWLDANSAYSRLAVTKQLSDQANLALDLAQNRYNLGLGSIVELSQAQVQATQAEISDVAARYLYRLAEAVLRFQTGTL